MHMQIWLLECCKRVERQDERSQDFSKGGGGRGDHTVCVKQRVLTRLSPEYCRLFVLKKKAYKGGGGGSRAPQDPPGYALERY